MPKVFGLEHLIYLLSFIIILIFTFRLIRKHRKNEKILMMIIKSLGLLLLGAIIWNRITIAIGRSNMNLL